MRRLVKKHLQLLYTSHELLVLCTAALQLELSQTLVTAKKGGQVSAFTPSPQQGKKHEPKQEENNGKTKEQEAHPSLFGDCIISLPTTCRRSSPFSLVSPSTDALRPACVPRKDAMRVLRSVFDVASASTSVKEVIKRSLS
jgi:hypothetical protein